MRSDRHDEGETVLSRRRLWIGIAVLCAAPWFGMTVASAEPLPDGLRLVMVEDQACVYCRKWMAEVGPYYGTSTQGRRAPLERRMVGDPSLKPFGRLAYTPTFLLVRDGREVDRLVGYGGAAEFWRQLEAMLAKAGDGGEGEAPGTPERREEPSSERDARLARPATDAMA